MTFAIMSVIKEEPIVAGIYRNNSVTKFAIDLIENVAYHRKRNITGVPGEIESLHTWNSHDLDS